MKREMISQEVAEVISHNFSRQGGKSAVSRLESFLKGDDDAFYNMISVHGISSRQTFISAVTQIAEVFEEFGYLTRDDLREVDEIKKKGLYSVIILCGTEPPCVYAFDDHTRDSMATFPKEPTMLSPIWDIFATPLDTSLRNEGSLKGKLTKQESDRQFLDLLLYRIAPCLDKLEEKIDKREYKAIYRMIEQIQFTNSRFKCMTRDGRASETQRVIGKLRFTKYYKEKDIRILEKRTLSRKEATCEYPGCDIKIIKERCTQKFCKEHSAPKYQRHVACLRKGLKPRGGKRAGAGRKSKSVNVD